MNGKRAKAIRKAIGKEKATPLDGGGLFYKSDEYQQKTLMFKRASNPIANAYRRFKKLDREH